MPIVPQHSTALGHNANIFQPPTSASSTSASPAFATATRSIDYFSPRARKRARPDSSHSPDPQETPWTASPGWIQCPTPSDAMYGSARTAQSSVLVNERYRLAGGFDTPGLLATDEDTSSFGGSEVDCRTRLRDIDALPRRRQGDMEALCGPLARERNGVARLPSSANGSPEQAAGWTSFAFGLVSKMFTFGSGMIRGFYAGDGKGYNLQQRSTFSNSPIVAPSRERDGGTPVPGSWRDDDEFLGDFEQDNPESPSLPPARPPNKRRQTDKDSWVMIGTPDIRGHSLSPKRKTSSTSIPRASLGGRPTASRANIRRSIAPSRRQPSYVSHTDSPAATYQTQNTIHDPLNGAATKRASIAPSRSPGSGNNPGSRPTSSSSKTHHQHHHHHHHHRTNSDTTHISPDAQRLMKRQAKQGKAADKAISGMSRRLEDLIRQGQEALGTKVSVEGGGAYGGPGEDVEMDEGFVDDDDDDHNDEGVDVWR